MKHKYIVVAKWGSNLIWEGSDKPHSKQWAKRLLEKMKKDGHYSRARICRVVQECRIQKKRKEMMRADIGEASGRNGPGTGGGVV